MELCADHDPGRLMAFLVASQAYPLEAAAQLCEQRGLVSEQVFVLGRMGASHRALELIIRRLADVPQARPGPARLAATCLPCRSRARVLERELVSAARHAGLQGVLGVAAQAVEFVQMQRDDELWELLISLALGSADLTGASQTPLVPVCACFAERPSCVGMRQSRVPRAQAR